MDDLPADPAPAAADPDFAALYAELAVLAHARLRRSGHITALDTSSLVHECWLRLQQAGDARFASRGAFLAYAARAMRSIVVDLARRRAAQHRAGSAEHVTLDTGIADGVAAEPAALLAVDEALHELARHDERLAQVVQMRFFAGLTELQIAEALGLSERTVRRDWERARAFLVVALQA